MQADQGQPNEGPKPEAGRGHRRLAAWAAVVRVRSLKRRPAPHPAAGRVLRRGPPIRCGPGARATCSAVLFGVLEAYPPVGTTPGVPGGAGGGS
jgi:hypothetical protein